MKRLTEFSLFTRPMRKKSSSKNNLITDLRTVHQQIEQWLSRSLQWEAILNLDGHLHTPLLWGNRNKDELLSQIRSLGEECRTGAVSSIALTVLKKASVKLSCIKTSHPETYLKMSLYLASGMRVRVTSSSWVFRCVVVVGKQRPFQPKNECGVK